MHQPVRIDALRIGDMWHDKHGIIVVVERQVVHKAVALRGVYLGFVLDGITRLGQAQDGRAGDGAEPNLRLRGVALQGAGGEFAVVVVFAAGKHKNFAP